MSMTPEPQVIEHRLEVYREKTLPMLDYYSARERLVQVNGARPEADVLEQRRDVPYDDDDEAS